MSLIFGSFREKRPDISDMMSSVGLGLLQGRNWSEGLGIGAQNYTDLKSERREAELANVSAMQGQMASINTAIMKAERNAEIWAAENAWRPNTENPYSGEIAFYKNQLSQIGATPYTQPANAPQTATAATTQPQLPSPTQQGTTPTGVSYGAIEQTTIPDTFVESTTAAIDAGTTNGPVMLTQDHMREIAQTGQGTPAELRSTGNWLMNFGDPSAQAKAKLLIDQADTVDDRAYDVVQLEEQRAYDAQLLADKNARSDEQLTGPQAQSTSFYERTTEANEILLSLGKDGNSIDSQGTKFFPDFFDKYTPMEIDNYFQTDEYQLYEQAKRNFINAVLRQESGAAIGKDEFDSADSQYFPIRGDGAAVIEQKRENRLDAINNFKLGSGGAVTEETTTPLDVSNAPETPTLSDDDFDVFNTYGKPEGTIYTFDDGTAYVLRNGTWVLN